MKRQDKLTGEFFTPTRNNQKFACSKNRIKFHNQQANKLRKLKSFVDKPLNKSFNILNDIMQNKNEAKFHKQFLLGKGFSFNVHTHFEIINNEKQFAIYNYVIIKLDQDNIKIIRNG